MKTVITGFILLCILAGCSSSRLVNSSANSLFQKWDLIWLNGDSIHKNPERPVYVEFKDSANRLSGFGGCNHFFSTFSIRKNSLDIKPVASTKMACSDKNITETENSFFQTISKVTSYKIEDGDLILFENKIPVAVFSKSNIIPDELSGHWELFYINGRKIAFEGLYPDKKPWLEFVNGKSSFSGFTSCNQIQAFFQNKKDAPLFKPGAMTLKACPGEGEAVFLDAFKKTDNYSISGDTLSLNNGNLILMKFIRKGPDS